jgi:tetratricopeptide (TPR) repeat protein
MKNLFLFIGLFIALNVTAQTPYQTGMQKAFSLWEQGKMREASQLFERISKVETENWLPSYYAATVEIVGSFGLKDEAILTAKLTKAQEFLDVATSLSENNPEIIITQALLNLGYIAYDGQKYGMTLSGKNNQLYTQALQISPQNPRVILGKAEWEIGAASFFGNSTKPYCEEIKRAITIGKKEKVEQEFYPKFMLERAEQVLKQCEG